MGARPLPTKQLLGIVGAIRPRVNGPLGRRPSTCAPGLRQIPTNTQVEAYKGNAETPIAASSLRLHHRISLDALGSRPVEPPLVRRPT